MGQLSRRQFLLAAGCALAAPSRAQVARKARIGYYGSASPSFVNAHLVSEFRNKMRELGYVEGKNLEIVWRYGGSPDAIAAEFVRMNVNLIVAASTVNATAARKATDRIPILIVSGDPVESGLVSSLARPGGNVTGLTTQTVDIVGKQLEMLNQLAPSLARLAVLGNPQNRTHAGELRRVETVARSLGAQPLPVMARNPEEIDTAFAEVARLRATAMLVLADGAVLTLHRKKIAELAAKHRIPAMHPRREHVEAGGLMSYGTDRREMFRQLAVYADKILKGAKPGDLPIEQASKFELVINRKAAAALSLTIPQELLGRADELID